MQDDSTSNDAIKSAIPRRQHFRLKATTTRNSDAPTYITQLRICNCTPYLIIRNESLKFTSLSQFSKLYCVCNVAKHHPLVFKPTSNSSWTNECYHRAKKPFRLVFLLNFRFRWPLWELHDELRNGWRDENVNKSNSDFHQHSSDVNAWRWVISNKDTAPKRIVVRRKSFPFTCRCFPWLLLHLIVYASSEVSSRFTQHRRARNTGFEKKKALCSEVPFHYLCMRF